MGRFIYFVLSPDGVIVAFLVSAVWIWARPRSAALRRIVLCIALFYTMASTYAVPAAVNRILTSGYRPFQASDVTGRPMAIVLLGGGEEQIVGWSGRLPVMNDSEAARVLEAWRVFQLVNPEWIVSSGGGPSADSTAETSSVVMRNVLAGLGVPPTRILVESSSMDTHDEAVLIVPMLKARGIDQFVLVTSAVHMPRAMGAFRAVGLTPIPAAAPDVNAFKPWTVRFLPSARGLVHSSSLVHELVGVAYYWSRGWWRGGGSPRLTSAR